MPGRDAVDLGLHHDGVERPVDPPATLEERGEKLPSVGFGISSSRSPAGVETSSGQCPLRIAVLVSVRSRGPAPIVAVSSASISWCSTQVSEVRIFSVSSPA
jgi:hypothetical protein